MRYGHSKDKRPDLLQYRQLLATLDPMGMPLVSATLGGNGADDPLYFPTWQQMVKVIGHKQFVFVADCKGLHNKSMEEAKSSWNARAVAKLISVKTAIIMVSRITSVWPVAANS